ncbi:glycosyltransferase family 1 protein [Mucilaginibacter conchicola]|uniref:Glycosyltransferase family 1 protein n=1 Tax=Mucilaginibacter conchicola TaxID=2303333 RepID=A0A372NSC2_9SPHI|nr:glycosyltransferase family 1 protein [Mucilaginibacter conchicola]RFZ92148.1 glycosyltransferase family 1 protein [Mucilaginibacter conchicola]
MLKIQFDHQAFSMQRYGGISRYFANIQKHLDNDGDFEYDRGLLFTNNHYLKDEKLPVPEWLWRALVKDRKVFKYNRSYSKYCIKNHRYDLFHPTYYNPYFLRFLKKPFVLTVHDFIHELFPEYFLASDHTVHHKAQLINKADHIIAISQSTLNDLQTIYNVPDDKVTLVYHGFEPTVVADDVARSAKPDYILYVGDRAGYKNFFKWLAAVAPLLVKYQLKAICAGGGVFTPTEQEFIQRLNIGNLISQTTATEQQLANLYAGALFFAYPSLYEGFGFPVLEAFANNCPVVLSNTSCFKEVGGDAAAYFDPSSIESMQGVMEQMISNSAALSANAELGKAQLAKFTIEKCMQQTADVYRKVINK